MRISDWSSDVCSSDLKIAISPAGLPPSAGTVNERTPRETLCPSVLRRLLGGLGCGRRAAVVGLGVAGHLLAAGHHQRRLAFQHHAVPDRADGIEDDPLLGGLALLHGDPPPDGGADLPRPPPPPVLDRKAVEWG